MDLGVIAALITALAAVFGAWVAYLEYKHKKNPKKLAQSRQQLPEPFELELPSTRDIDYTQLRELLASGKRREADKETATVMLKAAGRESSGYLRVEDIDNFPCEDLRIINQLWLHYSFKKFGFSIQKEIYESIGGSKDWNEKVWKHFCADVGWKKRGKWLNYSELTFDLNAPRGHLPNYLESPLKNRFIWIKSIAQRLEICNI